MDGGTIEVYEDLGIVSTMVFEDHDVPQEIILEEIKSKLGLSKLTVVPWDPEEPTGHVDGMARFIDRNTLLVSDLGYERSSRKYLQPPLVDDGYEIIILPSYYVDDRTEGWNSTGTYINYLKLSDLILMPSFGHELDEPAKRVIQNAFPNHEVVAIRSDDIARKGGVINCVTWHL